MKKISIEEHIMPKEYLEVSRAKRLSPSDDCKRKVQLENIEERLKDMDEDGIDMQVLSSVFHHNEFSDASEAAAISRRGNDALYQVIKRYPERLAGFAAVAPQEPATAADELARAVNELGLKGAMIFGHVRGEYLDNQKFWVILERAEKLGVPIYLHPSMPSDDMIKPFQTYPIMAGSMWGYSVAASLHAMRLICSGVFDKYPGLKIILGHLGEAIPLWLWRIDQRWQIESQELYKGDVTSNLRKKPSQYFKENYYVTTSGMFWPPALQFVQSVLGADRMLFAVDYPQESSGEAVRSIEATSISDGDKEKIFHINAEKLLGL
ncbi:amidohydrolase family protein [Chloroflexota bacterium]